MAVKKVLAKYFKVEIQTGVEEVTQNPIFTEVKGLKTIGVTGSKTDADMTTFDSEGYAEHEVAQRAKEISLEGFYMVDKETGARDPGQEAVEALADKIGDESIGTIRVTLRTTGAGKEYKVSANVEGPSGGLTDPTAWKATLTVSGKPVDVPANP